MLPEVEIRSGCLQLVGNLNTKMAINPGHRLYWAKRKKGKENESKSSSQPAKRQERRSMEERWLTLLLSWPSRGTLSWHLCYQPRPIDTFLRNSTFGFMRRCGGFFILGECPSEIKDVFLVFIFFASKSEFISCSCRLDNNHSFAVVNQAVHAQHISDQLFVIYYLTSIHIFSVIIFGFGWYVTARYA